jgi:hypothetical protein
MWSKLGFQYINTKVLRHRYPKWAHIFNFKLWARRIWPKKMLGIKVAIWFPTIKKWEIKFKWLPIWAFNMGLERLQWKRHYSVITCSKTLILNELQGSNNLKHYMFQFWKSIWNSQEFWSFQCRPRGKW